MTTIATVDLGDNVLLADYTGPYHEAWQERTIHGYMVLRKTPHVGGAPRIFTGWATKADIDDLVALTLLDGPHAVTLPDGSTTTLHFDYSGVPVEAKQVHPETVPDDTKIYSYTIRMLTVA